ncbi:MAG: SRPBCC family protein [Candidatus Saccharimonadales bacterium]|nr:SRPBCC family protein [Candidatus Saccharimonadales bacterium]
MKVTSEAQIDAPIEKVFEVFTDIGHAAERLTGVIKVEILSQKQHGAGLRWRETRKMFGKEATEEMEITKFNAPNMYQVDAESHGSHYTTLFYFEERGEGTHVKWEFIGTPISLGAKLLSILGFLAKGTTKKMMDQDIADLKSFIEG